MARGREETSTSGRPGGRLRATPSASTIISSQTMEELRAYCEVPDNIDLRLMEKETSPHWVKNTTMCFLPGSI